MKKEKLKKIDLNTAFYNATKAFLALMFSNFFGWLVNFLVFRGANEMEPESAAFRTIVLSIIIFSFYIYSLTKVIKIESKRDNCINESSRFKSLYKDSNYELDYKCEFKKYFFKRGWGYFIPTQLWQIPLIINYVIVSVNIENAKIYEFPIYIYKWCTTFLFAYELFPQFIFLGFLIFNLVFVPTFTYILYKYYKSLLNKPSYLK